jgi:muconolactone delta-isomerase
VSEVTATVCFVQSSSAQQVKQVRVRNKGCAGGELDAQRSDGGVWRHHGMCINSSGIPHSNSGVF